jgi:hypothetical protein
MTYGTMLIGVGIATAALLSSGAIAFESSKLTGGIVVEGSGLQSPKLSAGVVVEPAGLQSPKLSVGIVVDVLPNGGSAVTRAPLTHW